MSGPDDIESGARALELFTQLVRALELYASNNDIIQQIIAPLQETIQHSTADGDTLTLRILGDELFACGQLLRLEPVRYRRLLDATEPLTRAEVGALCFEPSVTGADMLGLAEQIAECLRSQGAMPDTTRGGLSAQHQTPAVTAATVQIEPAVLAGRLHVSLQEATRWFYANRSADPSALPLRRLLQLIIDQLVEHSGIYQMLSAPREHEDAMLDRRMGVCLDVLGFGQWLGLSRADQMVIGLAGLLGAMPGPGAPAEAIAPLLTLTRLGEGDADIIMAIHDARASVAGAAAGRAGSMLAVVESYHYLLRAHTPQMDPPAALKALHSGLIAHLSASLVRSFITYKGRCPIGTRLELERRVTGLVISQGSQAAGKRRPLVARLEAHGALGPRLDLNKKPDVRITGASSVYAAPRRG